MKPSMYGTEIDLQMKIFLTVNYHGKLINQNTSLSFKTKEAAALQIVIKCPDYKVFQMKSKTYIEVCVLKVLKSIENKFLIENTWAFFQENLAHFDIHALPWRKIKRKQ